MSNAENILIYFVLPTLGAALLLLCIAAFFFPFGQRLSNSRQKLKGFGVELEISVLTLFVIAGITFLTLGAYLRFLDFEKTVADLQRKVQDLQSHERIDVTWRVTLANTDRNSMPHIQSLRATMHVSDSEQQDLPIGLGRTNRELILTLSGVQRDLKIDYVEIVEQDSPRRRWRIDNIRAVEPRYEFATDASDQS